ncbi:MAG: PmoA family protein [Alphaproteobacteria bacterium]|jgi:hypothetical protein|nr:PmoA family protein [Alphaproteobacteria bacterium]
MVQDFSFEADTIRLPKGAVARAHRHTLRSGGRVLLALTQGPFRPYIYPLYTPSGQQVLEESPADHPHHNGVWVGSDHVHCRFPLDGGRHEDGTYCFYVNETFQGRARGRIESTAVAGAALDDGGFEIRLSAQWRGPCEWGAPEGRVLATEERTVAVHSGGDAHVIDLASELRPTEWELGLGPTRHAYFGIRAAESMRVTAGGRLSDAAGAADQEAISAGSAAWVDYSGPLAAGAEAGIAILAGAGFEPPGWFATDWGVVQLNPFARAERRLAPGNSWRATARLVVHDGPVEPAKLTALQAAMED